MVEPKTNRKIVKSFYAVVGDKRAHPEQGISIGDVEWIHPALGGAFQGGKSVINDVLIPIWQN